jgi:phage terminase large subunit
MRAQIPIAHGKCLYAPGVRHKALYGGRGSAKSWSVATYLVVEVCKRRLKIVCARQFMNAIRDSSKELIERRIRDLELIDQFIVTNQSILNRETGSEFTFIGLERNIDSIRSQEGIDVVWIEEARNVSKKSMEILLRPCANAIRR